MLTKIEHIGIAVKDLAKANEMFSKLSEAGLLKLETVESEGVKVSFFKVGDTKIEFLEPSNPESAIAKFIEKNGEGIHHIAFDVQDIEKEMDRLKDSGFEMIHQKAKEGADNKLICFLHPRSTNRVLIELCQEKISSISETAPGVANVPE
jgi:methylmalonyl-CoA/ethylmalonyl-CoA epimerase